MIEREPLVTEVSAERQLAASREIAWPSSANLMVTDQPSAHVTFGLYHHVETLEILGAGIGEDLDWFVQQHGDLSVEARCPQLMARGSPRHAWSIPLW